MTNFDKLKSMSIEDLVEFIDDNGMYDNTPWLNWWNDKYCDRCESVKLTSKETQDVLGITPFLNETYECAYCEVYNKCRYFPDKDESPSIKDIIRMWLEAESD